MTNAMATGRPAEQRIGWSTTEVHLASWSLVLLGMALLVANAFLPVHLIGAFPLAVLLMVGPPLFLAIRGEASVASTSSLLGMILAPFLLVNLTYGLRMGTVVGYQDPQNHLYYYHLVFTPEGRIRFDAASNISYDFVGLYIDYRFLEQITGIAVERLAMVGPPILNALLAGTAFILARRLHSPRVAAIAVILLAWENQVVVFGQEFRTQTLGVTLILLVLVLLTVRKTVPAVLALVLGLGAVVLSSFVSIVYAFVLLTTFLVGMVALRRMGNSDAPSFRFGIEVILLLSIASFTYVAYITHAFDGILLSLKYLYQDAVNLANRTPEVSTSVGQSIYGDFARFATYLLWLAFAIGIVLYLRKHLRARKPVQVVLAVGFLLLLGLHVVNSVVGPLSPGRIYAFAFVMIAIVVAWLCVEMLDWRALRGVAGQFLVAALVLGVVLGSAAKLPVYVFGDMVPLRGEEPIDHAPFWHRDDNLAVVDGFVCQVAPNAQTAWFVPIQDVVSLGHCGVASTPGRPIPTTWVVRTKFLQGSYPESKDTLPSEALPATLAKAYDSGDYQVYFGRAPGVPLT